ncbi:MAG: efflux RND transporter periplasmic adaptor subunit [Phycisphaerae bacterium]|nr:efflux RND transporter periplasmic adaptor subunit [Phycisphaerae bacterium]
MAKSEIEKRDTGKPDGQVRTRPGGWVQMIIAVVVVASGILGVYLLIMYRKPPQREEPVVLAPLVEVEQLHVQDIRMIVRGYGTVSPRVEVEIVPEVFGKVVYVHPLLKAGGLIRAKERIIQIDPRDYELAVQQADATVAEAQVRLDTEKAEADVARQEWEQLHPNTEPSSPLVLRDPQIRRAEASLKSAKAQLATANLRLERTSLSFPFDVLVINERVDLGQYVVVGQSLGSAYGIEAVEIEVPLEDDELAWFDVFDSTAQLNGKETAAKSSIAQVKADFGGAEHIWEGRVVRTTGQVDRTSRMISVVVEVTNPFDTSGGKPPLYPGVFADVLIEGKILADAVAVPRDAVRESNKVWAVDKDRLHIRTLKIARADREFAYAISGLEEGAQIVVSSLDMVTEGMAVRTQADNLAEGTQTTKGDGESGKTEAN